MLADVSRVSPSSEQRASALTKGSRSKRQPTHSLRRSVYPHQPYIDTLYILVQYNLVPSTTVHRIWTMYSTISLALLRTGNHPWPLHSEPHMTEVCGVN